MLPLDLLSKQDIVLLCKAPHIMLLLLGTEGKDKLFEVNDYGTCNHLVKYRDGRLHSVQVR